MKFAYLFLLTIVLILASCSSEDKYQKVVEETTKFMQELDDSLKTLSYDLIMIQTPQEVPPTDADKIKMKISALKNLMKEQQNKLDQLAKQDTSQLKIIKQLKKTLAAREKTIAQIQKKLNAAIKEIKELKFSAWYVVGTQKELEAKGFEYQNRGLMGYGGNLALKDDAEKDEIFEKVTDINKNTEIPLSGKFVRIHSDHSARRNLFEVLGDTLFVIKDGDHFWEISKYLVIEVQK